MNPTMAISSHPVLIVMAIAVTAPLLAEIPIGVRMPVAVLELLLGIFIGPHGFRLAKVDSLLGWFGGTLGLSALFFMAGMDLDLAAVRGRPLSLALRAWIMSVALAVSAIAILRFLPSTRFPIMTALALTTTAMGTFMPALRDVGQLHTGFGRFVLAAGAVGEFGPVVLVSLIFTSEYGAWQEAALMLTFVAIAVSAAFVALKAHPPKVIALLGRTLRSSIQLPVRLSLLLLASFVVLSEKIGLEAVLGAFAAGMVVSLASRGEGGETLRGKIEAISFGFLVPFFFVTSGMKFDVGALLSMKTVLLLPVFLFLLLLVRGTPVLLYRNDIAKNERLPFALYSATALPMVVAITEIGVRTGHMSSDVAAGLVGAGVVSVLFFPAIAANFLSAPGPTGPLAKATQKQLVYDYERQ
jgi:Kef-type K+ transport system membrane component KefB